MLVGESIFSFEFFVASMLWPWKGSLMKMQTWILDNRLYYTRKIELHRKGITLIVICSSGSEISVLITVRRVYYSKMGKVPTIIMFEFIQLVAAGILWPLEFKYNFFLIVKLNATMSLWQWLTQIIFMWNLFMNSSPP